MHATWCALPVRASLEWSGRWTAGTANMHERAIQELFARRGVQLSSELRLLRRLREHADYKVQVPLDPPRAGEALKKVGQPRTPAFTSATDETGSQQNRGGSVTCRGTGRALDSSGRSNQAVQPQGGTK